MSRQIYIWDSSRHKLLEVGATQADIVHGVITDEMEPVESYATTEGRVFTSKSALRRHYKENGVMDTGGSHIKSESDRRREVDQYRKKRREDIRETVAQQLEKCKWGMAPITEKEKAICQQEMQTKPWSKI